nr:class I mannose-6-phosphate isomerase [Clostridia bacterium]
GKTLNEFLGSESMDFPLLVKFLDAQDKLSVQVHPIKNEMWYIVEAEPGAELIMGLSEPYDREKLLECAATGKIDGLMKRVKVKPGECYYIPQGLVHAIGAGILIAEIQENSDITYRVYDYERRQKDGTLRQLHINEAADVIRDYSDDELEKLQYEHQPKEDGLLTACRSFTTRLIEVNGEYDLPELDSFGHILCLDGEGSIGDTALRRGDSCFIPKECRAQKLKSSGGMKLILSYPN